MNDEQKAAAEVMGYTKASWDKDNKESSGTKYENYDWKEVRQARGSVISGASEKVLADFRDQVTGRSQGGRKETRVHEKGKANTVALPLALYVLA